VTNTYFTLLKVETPTRVWVNNPTIDEIGFALAQGAVGCTTNPAYGGGLLKRAPGEVRPFIAEAVRATRDDAAAADLVQQRLVARIAHRFRPLYDASEGRFGYVSIQGAPEADTDADDILAGARANHAIGPNVTPKIPATAPGLEAFDVLVAEGYPTIVTEVFSLAQLVETCERYLRVTARAGARPPFYLSPITGIFGDHLKAVAARSGVSAANTDMELIGVAFSRACYRLVRERSYPVTLLCGGARIGLDLTGLVGADLHCTINWSTFAEVLADPAPFAPALDDPVGGGVIERLQAIFPDVPQAFALDGLTVEEFEDFGPVQHFRNNFIAGWNTIRAAIAEERAELATLAVVSTDVVDDVQR
jgi:transaldolase